LRVVPVILAGGSGARLWPLSTPQNPKQFALKGPSGLSLFQETMRRVADSALFATPLVVGNINSRGTLLRQLDEIDCAHARVVCEPIARNTAAAICLAALQLSPESSMLVLPSDHVIAQPAVLMGAVRVAAEAVAVGHIITFAIHPREANPAYGYIEIGEKNAQWPGLRLVRRFTEKPDAVTATAFLAMGNYGWNSGIFLMRAHTVIEEMEAHAPKILSACRLALAASTRVGEHGVVDDAALAVAPSLPFDRAVMEHTTRAMVITLDMGWSDMGSFAAMEQSGAIKP
jgi:mannose-1-phosphate guanylyltransferase/mannose-6-phosphate isomerase